MIDIGFIGLGTIGRPMAGHLLAAGHHLFVHGVGPIAPELVLAGDQLGDGEGAENDGKPRDCAGVVVPADAGT